MMDHRSGERLATVVPALVSAGMGEWMPSTIREVGTGGVFLETTTPFRHKTLVIVSISIKRGSAVQRHRFPALVVHRSDDGVGLRFAQALESIAPTVRDLIEVSAAQHDRYRAVHDARARDLAQAQQAARLWGG